MLPLDSCLVTLTVSCVPRVMYVGRSLSPVPNFCKHSCCLVLWSTACFLYPRRAEFLAASSSGCFCSLFCVFVQEKSGDLASELGDAFLTPLNQSSKLFYMCFRERVYQSLSLCSQFDGKALLEQALYSL